MAGQRKCNWNDLIFMSIIAYVNCHSGFNKQETELERCYSSVRPVCKYSREDWAGFWLGPLRLCKRDGFASALLSDLQGTCVSENMFIFSSGTGYAERGYYFPASHVLLISLDHCISSSATTLTDKTYLLFLLSYVVVDEKPRWVRSVW